MTNTELPEDPHDLAERLVGASPQEWISWQRRAMEERGPVDGLRYWARAREAAELIQMIMNCDYE